MHPTEEIITQIYLKSFYITDISNLEPNKYKINPTAEILNEFIYKYYYYTSDKSYDDEDRRRYFILSDDAS